MSGLSVNAPLSDDGERTSSDHKIIEVEFKFERRERGNWKVIKTRATESWRIGPFLQELAASNWSKIIKVQEVDEKVDIFSSMLDSLVDKHFPMKALKRRTDDKPWITDRIKKMITKRRRLFRRKGKCEAWRRLKKATDQAIKWQKRQYWQKKAKGCESVNNKNWWKVTRSLMSDKEKPAWDPTSLRPGDEEKEVADWMAEFFAGITKDFEPLKDVPTPDDHRPPFLLTEAEVLKVLNRQKVTDSIVPGDVPGKVFKKAGKILLRPLTSIYNAILLKGKWPNAWKRETGVAIPKVDSPSSIDQTRLIRLTPSFAKVGESVLMGPLMDAVGEGIDKSQFGGMSGFGTTEALVVLNQFVAEALEEEEMGVVLSSFDYSKAFDRTSHQSILAELDNLSCPTWLYNIIRSYLTGRRLVVRVKGVLSVEKELNGGSSQGAKLGVILFNIAGNRVTRNFPLNIKSVRFVDDLLNLEVVKVVDSLAHATGSQRAFEELVKEAKKLGMLINPGKTKALVAHRQSQPITAELTVPGTGVSIESEDSLKFLGYYIGQKMTDPEPHIREVEKKARSRLWMLRRLKEGGVEEAGLVKVYSAMIRSVIEYASPAYHPWLRVAQADRLERIQKRALRIIFGYGISYRRALEKSGLDRLDLRRDQSMLNTAEKMSKNPRFTSYFPKIERQSARTRRIGMYDDHEKWKCQALQRSPIFTMRRILNERPSPGNIRGIRYASS